MDRIDEMTRMCSRKHPIYEQISNFSIALYAFGFFDCPDLLSAGEVDSVGAGSILRENFVQITEEEVPEDYNIFESSDRYLLVIGDPVFPEHFAVIVDMKSSRPYFSKLAFFGSGFDSLEELETEFSNLEGILQNQFLYFKMQPVQVENKQSTRIYTIKDDGNYSVSEYRSATH